MDMQTTSRNLLAATATVAMLAAGVLPGSALAAGKRTVKDAKFDNVKVSRNGRIDITKVTASRDGAETKFAIAMRAKLKPARSKERPGIFINTRGNRRSSPEYVVFGSTIFKVRKNGNAKAVGDAKLTSSKRTWRFSFDASQVAALDDGYGWAAVTQKANSVADIAPDKGYVNSVG